MSAFAATKYAIILLIQLFLFKTVKQENEFRIKEVSYAGETNLNVTERVRRHGYNVEEHTAVTEDGYVLQLFRVNKNYLRGPPVLLMHGLLLSADAWVEAGPKAGLAYFLSDLGYDVWLGNARGNTYSIRHVTLDPDDFKFWQFSRDEMGYYDVPAMLDKVLDVTGEQQLSYIGFSQGAGTYFMMCDVRPEYCNKTNIMIALAPSTRHTLTTSLIFRPLSIAYATKEKALDVLGLYETLYKGGFLQSFFSTFCLTSDAATAICEQIVFVLDGFHPGSKTRDTIRNAVGHFPAGTSVQNMANYGQAMLSDKFQKFDFGSTKNREVYGSDVPPQYNLGAVTAPVVVLSGRNDAIVDINDVKWAVSRLPNVVDAMVVENPLWTHLDNCYSHLAPKYIFPKIEMYLNMYNHQPLNPQAATGRRVFFNNKR